MRIQIQELQCDTTKKEMTPPVDRTQKKNTVHNKILAPQNSLDRLNKSALWIIDRRLQDTISFKIT